MRNQLGMDKKLTYNKIYIGITILFLTIGYSCSSDHNDYDDDGNSNPPDSTDAPSPPASDSSDVAFWLIKADQSVLFEKQREALNFSDDENDYPTIVIDPSETFQSIDGYGFALTDGSALLIHELSSDKRKNLLNNLFSTESDGIGISYLRVTIGASDLSEKAYTYDDLKNGDTDVDLEHFTMKRDREDNYLIPVLKEILKINPDIKILGSPWSAPAWMKTNNSLIGGSLKEEYYDVYAQYFIKYIEKMKEEGIAIDAVTPQNEPLNPNNNPSMSMTSEEQAEFIKNSLGPAFEDSDIHTKIQIWDHNADRPSYPIKVLKDADARQYIDGSAFHLYNGSIESLSSVHKAFPDKNLYFTEQYTPSNGSFSGDLKWHVKNLIIGAMRNWSKNVIEWNLASDSQYEPHTEGGCNVCKGGITIDGDDVTKEVAYYIIASASKFVRPGAQRITSNMEGDLPNVAFQNKDGSKVLVVLNDGNNEQSFNIKDNGKSITTSLGAGSVGTYVWNE